MHLLRIRALPALTGCQITATLGGHKGDYEQVFIFRLSGEERPARLPLRKDHPPLGSPKGTYGDALGIGRLL